MLSTIKETEIFNVYYTFLQVAAFKIRYWDPDWQKSLSFLLSSTSRQVYTRKTVDEMLFAGYSDNLITMGKMMPLGDVPTYDRFGWFYMVCLLIREAIFSFLLISSEKNHHNARDILNTPRKLDHLVSLAALPLIFYLF